MSSCSQSPQFHTPGLSRQLTLQQRAHFMRFHPTPSEALLWSRLRARQLGVAFRRQVIIGSSIVDFCARAASLIVEVDGDTYHASRISADRCREQKLVRAGYTFVRVPASLVEQRVEEAVWRLRCALSRAR